MKKLLATTAVATILALNFGAATSASAGKVLYIRYSSDQDGNSVTVQDEDGAYLGGHFYNEDWEYQHSWYPDDIDPNPEGGDSGLRDADRQAIIEALKALGGAMERIPEFWLTPLGRDLAESGIGGFTATDPPPEYDPSALGYEQEDGYGGGTGGFDPMGESPQEAIRRNRGQGGGDDDDDDGDPAPIHQGETFVGPPELVNPVPIARLPLREADLRPHSAAVGR